MTPLLFITDSERSEKANSIYFLETLNVVSVVKYYVLGLLDLFEFINKLINYMK